MRKVVSSCEQLDSVSTCLCRKYIKFCFQNLGNDKEGKIERFYYDNEQTLFDRFC